MKKFFGIVLWSLILLGCSSDSSDDAPNNPDNPTPPAEVNFERSELLANWADNLIIPAYQGFSTSLDDLNAAFQAFNTTTDEVNLLAFRQAWIDAYSIWQRVSIFENGPAESVGYRGNINIFPTDESLIEQNVIDGNANLGLSSNRDAKGLPALDYLINGSAASDTAIVTRFNDPTEGPQLFAYTDALIQDMIELTDGVLNEWTSSFRDTFVNNDGSSVNASVDRMVNDYIFWYEFPLRRAKVELPSGVRGNPIDEALLEAFHLGTISNELCIEALQAARDFFNGVSFSGQDGIGLSDYLDALNAEDDNGVSLTDIINDQYDIAISSIENLSSFQEELQEDPITDLVAAIDELNRIIPLIKTDMLSFLNINVDFQDNDGD